MSAALPAVMQAGPRPAVPGEAKAVCCVCHCTVQEGPDDELVSHGLCRVDELRQWVEVLAYQARRRAERGAA